MKIGLISTTIYKLTHPYEGYGGIEPLVVNLTLGLAKKGHEVTVFAPKGSKLPEPIKVVETVEPSGVQYQYQHEENANKIITEYIEKNPLDILHDHTHQKYIYLYKAEHPELKLCSTLHNQVHFRNPAPGVKHMNLIGISDYHCLETSRTLGIHVERVYNGVDLDKFKYNEKKDNYFLYLSRISREKGVHEAIELARQKRLNLKVAGEDIFVDNPSFVIRVMQMCEGSIKYLGRVTEKKKIELLSNAKALIFPVLAPESFGLAITESLCSGTPVIAMGYGSIPEILIHRKTGFICSSFEELGFGVDMIEQIKPEDCRKRAELFSVENMVDNYEKLYKKILQGYEW